MSRESFDVGGPRKPSLFPVGAFTVSYLAMAAVGIAVTGNLEFVFYLGVMVVLIALVLLVHGRVVLTGAALWGLSLWGAAHMAGGLVPAPEGWPVNGDIRVLYSLWIVPGVLKYDHLVHAYGFGVTTWVCWEGLRAATGRHLRPSPGVLLLCAAAGMGFGALNEVVEFFAVLLVPETNVGGYLNTGWDLVANAVGAAVAVLLIRVRGGAVGTPFRAP